MTSNSHFDYGSFAARWVEARLFAPQPTACRIYGGLQPESQLEAWRNDIMDYLPAFLSIAGRD